MTLLERRVFKSFDLKDAKLFRKAENLKHVIDTQTWLVYRALHFNKGIFEIADFENLEDLFLEKMPDFSVSFTSLLGLPFSSDSLVMQISKKGKTIYDAIFISVSGSSESNLISPVLLVSRSHTKAITAVHQVIENVLGCFVRPVIPTEVQSYWLIGICLHETLRRGDSDITINCRLRLVSSKADIELTYPAESLSVMWKSIPDSRGDRLQFDSVKVFLDDLFKHYYCNFGILLSSDPIISCSLKKACVFFGEQLLVAVQDPEIALPLLSYIESDCT